MDRNFHIDDLERLLREKSDEFRMYPSKRIWNSIYNNIHPGRKWPSVAMSITLIIALLSVGYLNTRNANLYSEARTYNSLQKPSTQTADKKFVSQITVNDHSNIKYIANSDDKNETVTTSDNDLNSSKNAETIKFNPGVALATVKQHAVPVISGNLMKDKTFQVSQYAIPLTDNKLNIPVTPGNEASIVRGVNINMVEIFNDPLSKIIPTSTDVHSGDLINTREILINNSIIEKVLINDIAVSEYMVPSRVSHVNTISDNINPALTNKNFNNTEDKEWLENYALYNRPVSKKWANKLSWQMYATPSIVYRSLYSDPNFQNTFNAAPLAVSASTQNINEVVVHKPSIGFEMGTGIQYSILRGLKLKAGLQLNYTRYNSIAFENSHPVATKLTMHDFTMNTSYELYRTTPYSNKSGLEAVKLHNQTFQVSLPVGVDMKLTGSERFQWNLGVTIQPTYVIGGKSYLISSDRRNYVRETSMLNKWNLNAGIETFISYKVNGLTWQVGPQFRTQLFTTNSRKFAVEERLVNYGLKVGVSKTIK